MRDGKAHLRLDRRLARRRGWISADDLGKAYEDLPDVAEKGEMIDMPGAPSDDVDDSEAGEAPNFH